MNDTQTTDLAALETALSARIAQSTDEAALEAVRVDALGKSGAISALMKTLGAMSPDARKDMGPKLNGLRDRITEALTTRKATLAEAALETKLLSERVDISLPPRPTPRARRARHVLLRARPKGRTQIAPHTYECGASAHDARAKAADPHDLPGPHVPRR